MYSGIGTTGAALTSSARTALPSLARQLERGDNVAHVVARTDELASALEGLQVSDFRLIDEGVADQAVRQARGAAEKLRTTSTSLVSADGVSSGIIASAESNSDGLRAALSHMSAAQTRLERVANLTHPAPSLVTRVVDRIGTNAHTLTQRRGERPYGIPKGFEMQRVTHGKPLDLANLDPQRKYIWVVDEAGDFLIAPERQNGFGVSSSYPGGRLLKHGDLIPSNSGKYRAAARAGGEMRVSAATDSSGNRTWVLDNNSSYSFQRARKSTTGKFKPVARSNSDNLVAVKDLLELGGTDISRLRLQDWSGNVVWKFKPPARTHGSLTQPAEKKSWLQRLLTA